MPLLVWSLQGAVPCSGRFYMHRLTQQLLHRASLDPSVFIAEDQDSSLQVTVCVRSMWTLLLLGKQLNRLAPTVVPLHCR